MMNIEKRRKRAKRLQSEDNKIQLLEYDAVKQEFFDHFDSFKRNNQQEDYLSQFQNNFQDYYQQSEKSIHEAINQYNNEYVSNVQPNQINEIYQDESNLNLPRFSQIQKSLEVLRNTFPLFFTDYLIDKFYLKLVQRSNQTPVYAQSCEFPPDYENKLYGIRKRKKVKQPEVLLPPQQQIEKIPKKSKQISQEQASIKKKVHRCKRRSVPHKKRPLKIFKITEIWTEEMQQYYLELYLSKLQFNKMKKKLTQKYPQFEKYFGYREVRGEIYKILRSALRMLSHFILQLLQYTKLPELVQLTSERMGYLFYYKSGLQMRYMLVEMYRAKSADEKSIANIINGMNKFVRQVQQTKSKQQQIMRTIVKKGFRKFNKYFLGDETSSKFKIFYLNDDPKEKDENMDSGYFQ